MLLPSAALCMLSFPTRVPSSGRCFISSSPLLCPPISAFLSLAVPPSSRFMPRRTAFFPKRLFRERMASCAFLSFPSLSSRSHFSFSSFS